MDSVKAFKEKLDQEHKWPTDYMFKFVVPAAKENEVEEEFPSEDLQKRLSKAGNYIAFTFKKLINNSDEVVEIYQRARKIEGLIAL